jgi:ubiquinone/menaquinone biosynthesis C-methylase UbiE
MNHADHVGLIKRAVSPGGTWADFGSGYGAFTLALADILGREGRIYSIDKNNSSLSSQKQKFVELFPQTRIRYILSDFRKRLDLPQLDGIIMANSLHFVEEKISVLEMMCEYLKEGGKFVLVEYNVDVGNQWVPYPISFKTFKKMVQANRFSQPKPLGKIASTFLKEIYSCYCMKI